MKKSTAILLALIATGLLALAFMNRTTDTASDAGKVFLPALKTNLDSVSEVTLTDTTDSVTLQRQGSGDNVKWVVTNRDGYPANVPNIRKLLRNLADATLVERKTDNPELYNRLGVAAIDQASEGDSNRRVQIKAGEKTIADIIIGNRSDRGSYMRKTAAKESWLVNRDFLPGTSATDWLDDKLIAISSEQLQKVEVQPETGPAYEIGRGANGEFTLSPTPPGREASPSGLARSASAIRSLQLVDVAKDENQPTEGWAESRWYSIDGLVVSIKTRKEADTTVARVVASVTPEAGDDAKAAADELNAKVQGRLIRIPEHLSNNLRLTLDQVTKAVEVGSEG